MRGENVGHEHEHGHEHGAEQGHEHRPGGHTETASQWDARYGAARHEGGTTWTREPNAWVESELRSLPAGRALDLGAGEGRNALWLASRGWRVTAVDYSAEGIATGRERAAAAGLDLDWVVADVTEWVAPEPVDLVLLSFVHVGADALARVIRNLPLAPGGTLAVIGHDRANTVGGPDDPAILLDADELRRAAQDAGLEVVRAGTVSRPTARGDALDTDLVARRPAVDAV